MRIHYLISILLLTLILLFSGCAKEQTTVDVEQPLPVQDSVTDKIVTEQKHPSEMTDKELLEQFDDDLDAALEDLELLNE